MLGPAWGFLAPRRPPLRLLRQRSCATASIFTSFEALRAAWANPSRGSPWFLQLDVLRRCLGMVWASRRLRTSWARDSTERSNRPIWGNRGARGMFRRDQRYFFIVFCFVVFAPLITGLLAPQATLIVQREKRPLNELPNWPSSFEELATLSAKLDAYLADRYGLRYEMIRLYANLNRRLLRAGNEKVFIGSNDRMFLRLDQSVLQSAGIVRRDNMVADTVTMLVEMNDLLKEQGIRFVVASPPNSASIYPDELPRWLRNQGRFTEYDLLLGALRAQGLNVVDLRAPLRQARTTGNMYFLHDTHWTPRGSIIGFNSVAEAAGHPDWKLDADASLVKPISRLGGDLARMIGVEEDVTGTVQNFSLAASPEIGFPSGHAAGPPDQPAFSEAGRQSGETLLVLGDSFTRSFFPPLLVGHVGRLVWMHHQWCGFDWALVDKFHPDEVWWMPTERYFICRGRPEHFPS
jgi:alginate O-acetyltransferase complex protein AlgJ